jgi:phosphoglycerol transferase MdoB-like AlkP superfamily enzyme
MPLGSDQAAPTREPSRRSDERSWTVLWRARVGILLQSLVFWMVWFLAARALFYAWHWRALPPPDRLLALQSFWYGARMDLSAAAYLLVVPWLLLIVTVAAPAAITRRLLATFGLGMLVFVSIVTLTDIGTFGPWRRRLDASIWTYLASPREAYASAESIALGPLLGVLAITVALGCWIAVRRMRRWDAALAPVSGRAAISGALSIAATGLVLAVPIRGGLQWTPINESTVFFSRSEMANTGALNAAWYLLYSTIAAQGTPEQNPYTMLSRADAAAAVDTSLLRIPRPNVVLIVWESFTAKVVRHFGGRDSVTPQFARWTRQGVLFDSVFASGDRSAQGLVAILSGFPSVPHDAIMTRPRKASSLPQLGVAMRNAGYRTSYYYGGELAFANMKAYVLHGGFDRVTGIEAFPDSQRNSKWGAHDHVVLDRALRELGAGPRPFFSTVFTLSSHEPFEVPEAPVFPGTDLSTQFLNAHHYSDASIGQFLDAASQQPWWDSTLVVIIADHGSPLPEPPAGTTETVPARHHIPMLWVGGALRVRDTVVHRIGTSVDLAPTLLTQLQLPRDQFRWGHNLLQPGPGGFAWFAHQEGFAFIDQAGWLVFDERSRREVAREGAADRGHWRRGSALLQAAFDDYLSR